MNIGIWGDSIAYGNCDTEALGWVGRLRKSFPIEDYVGVYNFGVCGNFVTDILARFETEASSIKPEIIFIAVGINDSKYPKDKTTNNTPLHVFTEKMNLLIEQAKNFTNTIYIVGTTKISVEKLETRNGSIFCMKDIALYNDQLKTIAQLNKVEFIDVFDTIDPTTDIADGLHPNSRGYQKMFEVISNYIQPKLAS